MEVPKPLGYLHVCKTHTPGGRDGNQKRIHDLVKKIKLSVHAYFMNMRQGQQKELDG